MTIEDITDNDLLEFLQWFAGWHGLEPVAASVMITAMTGHFKTHPKAADRLLTRCRKMMMVEVTDGVVTIHA